MSTSRGKAGRPRTSYRRSLLCRDWCIASLLASIDTRNCRSLSRFFGHSGLAASCFMAFNTSLYLQSHRWATLTCGLSDMATRGWARTFCAALSAYSLSGFSTVLSKSHSGRKKLGSLPSIRNVRSRRKSSMNSSLGDPDRLGGSFSM